MSLNKEQTLVKAAYLLSKEGHNCIIHADGKLEVPKHKVQAGKGPARPSPENEISADTNLDADDIKRIKNLLSKYFNADESDFKNAYPKNKALIFPLYGGVFNKVSLSNIIKEKTFLYIQASESKADCLNFTFGKF